MSFDYCIFDDSTSIEELESKLCIARDSNDIEAVWSITNEIESRKGLPLTDFHYEDL